MVCRKIIISVEMSEKKEEKGGFVVHVYSAGNQIIQTQTNNYYGTVYQGRKELVSDDVVRGCWLSPEVIARCFRSVGLYVWGKSSLATIYRVCCDIYDYDCPVSQFERDLRSQGIDCPDGTITAAMYNNSFLRDKVADWQSLGVKDRVLRLAEEFQKAVESERSKTEL